MTTRNTNSWKPTRKWAAGFLTALVYTTFDIAAEGALTRSHLDQIVPQLTVLAAFYLVPDSQ